MKKHVFFSEAHCSQGADISDPIDANSVPQQPTQTLLPAEPGDAEAKPQHAVKPSETAQPPDASPLNS